MLQKCTIAMNGCFKCLKNKDWHFDTLRNRDFVMLQGQVQPIGLEKL